jgi:RimJ/RimL family protein N-acetyltransferase
VQPVTLSDGQVVLRPLREDDLSAIVTACQDPETVRWTTIPDPYGEAHARDFVFRYAGEGWAEDTRAVFAVADPDTDQYLGSIDLRLSPDESAEVGYAVAPWARGRGVGTAALRLICRWGLEVLGLQRIEWQAEVGNDASRRVAERVGFVVEGTCRKRLVHRGRRVDGWIGSLLPGELR